MSIKVQVDGYARQVERFAGLCALARRSREDADLFLWNAYRCLEAMLRALLVPYPPRRFSALSVEELLEDATERQIIPRDQAEDYRRLWRLSRIVSQVRDHIPPDTAEYVPECSERLAKALRWFYEKSPARREASEALLQALETLESAKPLRSREEAARQREERLVAALEEVLASRRANLEALEGLSDQLRRRLGQEREALDQAVESAKALKEDRDDEEVFQPPEVEPPRGGSELSELHRWGWLVGLAFGILLGLFLGWSLLERGGGQEAEEASGASSDDGGSPDAGARDRTVAESGRDHHDAGGADDAGATATRGGSASSSRCPPDMVEFDAAVVKVMQPFPRATWPPGPKNLPPHRVPAFCMDRDPVLVSDYEKCAAAGACRPRVRCLDHPRNFPVNCVTWEQADQYCRWKGGSLPTVLQWERTLQPDSKVRVEPSRGTWEWVADPFPAAVFERGPVKRNPDGSIWGYMALQKQFVPSNGSRRICSWHKAPASTSRGNLSFRCAITLERRGDSPAEDAGAASTNSDD